MMLDMVKVQPKTAEKLRQIVADHPDLCPAYLADCGTGYRVIHLKGFSGLPAYYAQFEGAVIEWLPGAQELECNAAFFRTAEDFGHVFANIDILAHRV